MQGTIKMVNHEKGWGFIRADSGQEVFFHRSAVHGQAFELVERQQPVDFEIGQSKDGKGPRASRVQFS